MSHVPSESTVQIKKEDTDSVRRVNNLENLVKDIIHQVLGNDSNSPFSRGDVARARLFGPDIKTEVTGIITSHHENGWYTLFVPTGPNPTSGMMYHLPPEQVTLMPTVKVDEALRTIISCGAGSGELFSR